MPHRLHGRRGANLAPVLDPALLPEPIEIELDWTTIGPHGWAPPHGIPVDAYVPFSRILPPDEPLFVDGGLRIELVPIEEPHPEVLDESTTRLLDAIAGWEPALAAQALESLATEESLPLELRSECALRLAERVEPGSPRAAEVLATVLRAWMHRD